MPPVNLILFGATGDLARYKILPALRNLWITGMLRSESFNLILTGRRELDTEEYLTYIAEEKYHPFTEDISMLHPNYVRIDFESPEGFSPLWEALSKNRRSKNLFYMAIDPEVLQTALTRLNDPTSKNALAGFPRNIFLAEKPFGSSTANAGQLNRQIAELFGHPHIYRNDHYLFKDSVQSLIPLRRQDIHLQNLLNKDNLQEIRVVATEEIDIEGRGAYFDRTGISIDWFQSHILQILALTCADLNMEHLNLAKAEFISSLEVIPHSITRGQYFGYRRNLEVDPDSQTETLLGAKFISHLPRWQGVTFSFICGKALDKKEVSIQLFLRDNYGEWGDKIRLRIDPPGGNNLMDPSIKEEFEELLLAAANEQSDRFISAREVEAQWRITENLREQMVGQEIFTYPSGATLNEATGGRWSADD